MTTKSKEPRPYPNLRKTTPKVEVWEIEEATKVDTKEDTKVDIPNREELRTHMILDTMDNPLGVTEREALTEAVTEVPANQEVAVAAAESKMTLKLYSWVTWHSTWRKETSTISSRAKVSESIK